MDRIEFIHSINREQNVNIDLINIIINFFDQYMFIYDLAKESISCDITSFDEKTLSISFELCFRNNVHIESLSNYLSTIPVVYIYQSYYSVEYYVDINTNRINITISKK